MPSWLQAALLALVNLAFFFSLMGFTCRAGAQDLPQVRHSVKPLNLSRAPTTAELMAAGQLGGQLYPTHFLANKAREREINLSFGVAIQAWNMHEYREAVEMFRRHVAQYPDSPWAGEAVLHVGCDALYNGRYTEAGNCFNWILAAHLGSQHQGARIMVNKARTRLANLKTLQGNFPEALEHYRLLKATSSDWRDRTYAAHWIQRLSREKREQLAIFNCGTQALAHLLRKKGQKSQARDLLKLVATSPRGHSMRDLKSLAASHGYQLTGLKLTVAQLGQIPLPAIVQLTGRAQGDRGHYWVLEGVEKNVLKFFDPQSRNRFRQTGAEFAREWGGNALVFAGPKGLPGLKLAAREMADLYGGCCGVPRKPSDLGKPDNKQKGCGEPVWSVNPINLNFFVTDTPLWYRSPIGPPVEITLSYNSQSSIVQHEPFGNKWAFNYGCYLVEDTGGTVTVFMPDGRNDTFTPDDAGGFTPPTQVFNRLDKVAASHYELRFPDDTVYVFDIPGGTTSLQPFLVEIRDARGLKLTFGYDPAVLLKTITDAVGRATTLTYDANNLVTQVTDPFGRTAAFSYDGNKNLVKITDMGNYAASFTYDQDNFITSLAKGRGAWNIYTEPADGIYNGSNGYPAPGGDMWEDFRVTVTLACPVRPTDKTYVINIQPGNWTHRNFGLAFDIGTTTVYGQLVDLHTGRILAEGGEYNSQMGHGEDVITRIIFAETSEGLQNMQHLAVETINHIIGRLLYQTATDRDEIGSITLAGNTTMTHLFLGLEPHNIRRAPYVPVSTLFPPLRGSDLGLDLANHTVALVYPAISSYVGGDIVAGVMGSGMYRTSAVTLYIDIGTNAEIVIGNREWLACAACSAGPAFEGGGITHGMRAAPGAIEDFSINPANLEPMNITVGGRPPRGICGSGLLTIVATLFAHSIIDQRGKFDRQRQSPRLRDGRSGAEYVLAWRDETGGEADLVINEVDIENFLRAKAAIYAGVKTLLGEVGLAITDLEQIILAGAFGSYIDLDHAMTVGLLPEVEPAKIKYVGNGSLMGARMSALSNHIRQDVRDVVHRMTSFELSEVTSFKDHYVGSLFLPHTDWDLFPRARARLVRRSDTPLEKQR